MKRDKDNKQRISIIENHQLPNHKLEWIQKAKNTSHRITGSFYRAYKAAKTSITKTKTVSFATTRQACIFQTKEVTAMITYDSGADGHYLSKRNSKIVCLPIMRPSTKRVGVANSGTSTARHVSKTTISTTFRSGSERRLIRQLSQLTDEHRQNFGQRNNLHLHKGWCWHHSPQRTGRPHHM